MTSRPSKKIKAALIALGFSEHNTHHIKLQYIAISGDTTQAKTYISHGFKDYGDKLLHEISKQLYLNKNELLRLIDGDMCREEYEHILKVKGII